MKKAILFSLSVCLIAALLIFSGSTDRGSEATNIKTAVAASPSASAAPAENVIRVGVPATMTGLGASDDARVLLGLQYAHSVSPSVEIGSTTYKIELVKQDDGGTAAGAQSAAQALKKAGVSEWIEFREGDAAKLDVPAASGVMVTNPPYGERMLEQQSAQQLYRRFGRHVRFQDGWKLYLISSEPEFEYWFGKKADKKRKLYNGRLQCNVYMYFQNKTRDGEPRRGGNA